MKNTNEPIKDLATDFLQIHTLITNALKSAVGHAAQYEETGFKNNKQRDGFAMFNRCLGALMHIHHRGEDTIFLPYLEKNLPDLSTSFVDEQHKEIEELLNGLTVELEQVAKEDLADKSNGTIATLRATLDNLNDRWLSHIEEEQRFISEQAAPRISREDQEMLMAELQEHGMGAAKPMSVMGAFMFYNFEPEMRAEFFSDAPWFMKDLLVPYIWRPKWAKMKPYLPHLPS